MVCNGVVTGNEGHLSVLPQVSTRCSGSWLITSTNSSKSPISDR